MLATPVDQPLASLDRDSTWVLDGDPNVKTFTTGGKVIYHVHLMNQFPGHADRLQDVPLYGTRTSRWMRRKYNFLCIGLFFKMARFGPVATALLAEMVARIEAASIDDPAPINVVLRDPDVLPTMRIISPLANHILKAMLTLDPLIASWEWHLRQYGLPGTKADDLFDTCMAPLKELETMLTTTTEQSAAELALEYGL